MRLGYHHIHNCLQQERGKKDGIHNFGIAEDDKVVIEMLESLGGHMRGLGDDDFSTRDEFLSWKRLEINLIMFFDVLQ